MFVRLQAMLLTTGSINEVILSIHNICIKGANNYVNSTTAAATAIY